MKKGAFVIPYFGKFNNYYQLFLESCKYNPDYDWIIFTDDCTSYEYPTNVLVHYTSFDDIRQLIQSKFKFKISLDYPYKLCDYKVAYGYIFEEWLDNYQMWGHCDTDVIFGCLNNFISDEDIIHFDKIGIFGHCTLYKNTYENNRVFLKPLDGTLRYKQVFTEYWNHSFDEDFDHSINNIFEQEKKKIRYAEYQANIYTKSSDFRLTALNSDRHSYRYEKNKKAIFLWNEGILNRFEMVGGNRIVRSEYMYIHMQSRKMTINTKKKKCFKIIPNSFEDLEVNTIDANNFKKIKIKHFNLHYFKLRSKNLFVKIKKFILRRK